MESEQVTCTHCEAQVEVASSLFGHVAQCPMCQQRFSFAPRRDVHVGAHIRCMRCGETIPADDSVVGSILGCPDCGGQFAGPAHLPPSPAQRREAAEAARRPPGGGTRPQAPQRPSYGPNAAITSLAVTNFIFGGLAALLGILILIVGTALARMIVGAGAEGAEAAAGIAGAVVIGIGVFILLVAALYIVAGVGLLKRRQYGRIICFVLAALHIINLCFTIFQITQVGIQGSFVTGILINVGYSAAVFATLLNSSNAAEFG